MIAQALLQCIERGLETRKSDNNNLATVKDLQPFLTSPSLTCRILPPNRVYTRAGVCVCVSDNRLYEVRLTDKSLIAPLLQPPNSSEEVLTQRHHNPLHLTRAISCNTCNNMHLAQSSHQKSSELLILRGGDVRISIPKSISMPREQQRGSQIPSLHCSCYWAVFEETFVIPVENKRRCQVIIVFFYVRTS